MKGLAKVRERSTNRCYVIAPNGASRRVSQSCYKVAESATLIVLFRPRNVRASSSITSRPPGSAPPCPISIPQSHSRMNPIAAGSLIVATIILCAGIGFGLGALVGLAVPLGILGLFAGVAAGLALVITRFRDL